MPTTPNTEIRKNLRSRIVRFATKMRPFRVTRRRKSLPAPKAPVTAPGDEKDGARSTASSRHTPRTWPREEKILDQTNPSHAHHTPCATRKQRNQRDDEGLLHVHRTLAKSTRTTTERPGVGGMYRIKTTRVRFVNIGGFDHQRQSFF